KRGVDQTKDHRICSNTERERQSRDDRDCRFASHHSAAVEQILPNILHEDLFRNWLESFPPLALLMPQPATLFFNGVDGSRTQGLTGFWMAAFRKRTDMLQIARITQMGPACFRVIRRIRG